MKQKTSIIKQEWCEEKHKEWVDGYWKLKTFSTARLFEYTKDFIRSLVEEIWGK